MNLITANEKDIPAIQRIAFETWHDVYSTILSGSQINYMLDKMYSTEALTNQMERLNHRFILSEENGDYTGFVSYESNYSDTGKTKIHKIYVHPSHQKKGIGERLINEVVAIAEKNCEQAVILNMNKQNPAINFYNKMVFNIVGEEVLDIGQGFVMDDYILEKKLSANIY